MKKIKVLNVISKLVYGGTESVIYNYYSNIDLENFESYIITRTAIDVDVVKKFENIGFKVYIVGDWEKHPYKVGIKIFKILKNEKFDIIHSHLSHTNFYFMILGKIAGIKIRISHSHLTYKDENFKQKLKHFIYKELILLFSTNLMACTKAAAIDLYGKRDGVFILKNAIDSDKFIYNKKVRDEYRRKLKINDGDFVYGNVGRLTKQKNQLFLLKIIYELKKKEKNLKLLLVGDGELKEKLFDEIKNLNLSENIIFLSNRDDVNCLYQAMDAFILPSLYEGLGIVLIEAQASGLQCYASKYVVPAEASITNKCMFISLDKNEVEWAEMILKNKNLSRKSEKEALIKSGYDLSTEKNKLVNYYKTLIKGRII